MMLRFILILILALVGFVGALAGVMAVTGNLSKEAITKIIHPPKQEAKPVQKSEPVDSVDPIVRALKDRDEQLKQREAKVTEDEERVKLEQKDLDDLRAEVQQLLGQVMQHVSANEEGHDKAIQDLAKTLAAMKPENAADSIAKFSAEDAAAVLRAMKEKESGKILDQMQPDQRAMVMRALTQPVPSSGGAGASATP